MSTPLQTQSTGSLFGGVAQLFGTVFQTIGEVAKTAIPPAADLYKLRLQGQTAASQLAADQTALQREIVAKQPEPFRWQPWMTYTAIGLAVVAGFAVLRRK